MASKQHQLVKSTIDTFITETIKRSSKPIAERVRKITLFDPETKSIIKYTPDFAFRRYRDKNSYYYVVFEVIEKQSQYKTMADILNIFSHPQIRKAIFISCNKEKKYETDETLNAITACLKQTLKKGSGKEALNIVSREALPTDRVIDVMKMLRNDLKENFPILRKPKKHII